MRAQQWAARHTLESFRQDDVTVYAVTRALEIVSEASRRLPQDIRERHPVLPWRAIMDVGNFYRHAYDNVSEDAVWRTVQHDLAPLLDVIDIEIARCKPLELAPDDRMLDVGDSDGPEPARPILDPERGPDIKPGP